MTLQAFLLCDSAITDAATGKVSVQGIFGRVSASQFPCAHPSCALFFQLRVAPGEKCDLKLQLEHSNGAREQPLDLPMGIGDTVTGIVQGIINMNALPLHDPGTYTFSLIVNGSLAGTVRLTADKIEDARNERPH